jgi:hypothetical protein
MSITRLNSPPLLTLAFACLLALACSESDTTGPDAEPVDNTDRDPPRAVGDLAISYPVIGGSARLTWTAPGDEGGEEEAVDRYELRYSYSYPLVWDDAPAVPNPPDPAPAGQPDSCEITAPQRARHIYAAVRSFDASGNPSPIGNVARAYIPGLRLDGRCADVHSGAAPQGLPIQIADRRVRRTETDALGSYRFDEIAPGVVHLSVRSSPAGTRYHDYNRTWVMESDLSLQHVMIEYAPTELAVGGNVLKLLLRAIGYNNYNRLLNKWKNFPIDVYVPAFVNGEQLDYEDVCREAVAHWNERVGSNLFTLVDTQPETGVWFQFKTRDELAPHIGVTHHENDGAGFPKTSAISIVNDFADRDQLWKVALHELGHTLRFRHLPEGYLMYGGQPLPMTVTNDEIAVIRLYLALPNRSDMSFYNSADPE